MKRDLLRSVIQLLCKFYIFLSVLSYFVGFVVVSFYFVVYFLIILCHDFSFWVESLYLTNIKIKSIYILSFSYNSTCKITQNILRIHPIILLNFSLSLPSYIQYINFLITLDEGHIYILLLFQLWHILNFEVQTK